MKMVLASRPFASIICIAIALICAACGAERRQVRVITNGSHVLALDSTKAKVPQRYVVWGNHEAMVGFIMQEIIKDRAVAIERAYLQEVINEKAIKLTNTSDDDAEILRVGRSIGADHIIFGNATVRPEPRSGAVVSPTMGAIGYSGNVYHLSVSVRSVQVETGEVRWSGMAQFNLPINDPENGLVMLTRFAVSRATCPIEKGYQWREDDGIVSSQYGCIDPSAGKTTQSHKREPAF